MTRNLYSILAALAFLLTSHASLAQEPVNSKCLKPLMQWMNYHKSKKKLLIPKSRVPAECQYYKMSDLKPATREALIQVSERLGKTLLLDTKLSEVFSFLSSIKKQ